MKRTLSLFFLLGLVMLMQAQIRIPGTRMTVTLPEGEWKYLQTTNIDNNTAVYLYSYTGELKGASANDEPPCMRVYVRKGYKDNALMFAYERSVQQPFQSLSEYTEGLPGDGGIGYIGAYTNPNDKKDYVFRMICFTDRNTAIEVRLENLRDTYDQMDSKFEAILKTVKTN